MHRRIPLALTVALLASQASAQLLTFTARGTISFAETVSMPFGTAASSVVQSEYALGTPFEMTFRYDVASLGRSDSGAAVTRFDAPFLVSARIGGRRISANSMYVERTDAYPWAGDGYAFRVDPVKSSTTTGLTPTTITESDPFLGSGFSLTGFEMRLVSPGDVTFGSSLPSSWDLDQYTTKSFSFSYHRNANPATNLPEQYANFRGGISSITAVPEPMTLAVLGLGMGTLLRRRRSR